MRNRDSMGDATSQGGESGVGFQRGNQEIDLHRWVRSYFNLLPDLVILLPYLVILLPNLVEFV